MIAPIDPYVAHVRAAVAALPYPPDVDPSIRSPRCLCRGPMVLRSEHRRGGEIREDHALVCVACGTSEPGTQEQIAQATAARDAWAVHPHNGRATPRT